MKPRIRQAYASQQAVGPLAASPGVPEAGARGPVPAAATLHRDLCFSCPQLEKAWLIAQAREHRNKDLLFCLLILLLANVGVVRNINQAGGSCAVAAQPHTLLCRSRRLHAGQPARDRAA